jgi:predicted TIM-barrel fold metal-dependent hydrolase
MTMVTCLSGWRMTGKDGDEIMDDKVFVRDESARSANCMLERKVIDTHVHVVGRGDTVKGFTASLEFVCGPAFSSMLMSLKTPAFAVSDEKIMEDLLGVVNSSESTDYAVFLAMDGVYKNGKFVARETHLMVPNDYIIGLSRTNKKVLFGASVHPYREAADMLAVAKRCTDEGAALFVWSPSEQQINPEDDRCIPLYVCLAREGIPLLLHTGSGFAPHMTDFKVNNYSDPQKLKNALDIGVKVIVSRCAASPDGNGTPGGGPEDLLDMLRTAEEKKWDLYADISACCAPSQIGYLERIRREIEEGRISPKRFLYGSDFPMPSVDINVVKEPLSTSELVEHISGQGNPLDNHYRILKDFGIHESIFTNACDVLRL